MADAETRTVRDYLRGWVQYHSGPEADVEAIIEQRVSLRDVDLDAPLDDDMRRWLDKTLGTKDQEDAPTPLEVLEAHLAEHLPDELAQEAAHLFSYCMGPFLDTWDLTKQEPIPKFVAQSLEESIDGAFEEGAYEELRRHLT